MAAPSAAVLARPATYICNSCKAGPSLWSRARPTTARAVNTSSFIRRTTRPAQQPSQPGLPIPRREKGELAAPCRIGSWRDYSTAENALRPTDSGVALLPHRRLIHLSGPDTVKLLQGLVTNNVYPERDQPFFAAFLDSRGRVLWDVFVWVYPELLAEKNHWSCYIEVEASEVEALRKHLKRHKLRSKVAIELVPEEELGVWAAWGEACNDIDKQAVRAAMTDPRSDRSTLWRLLAAPDSRFYGDKSNVQDEWQYHLQRYRQGIAEGPQEISRESALPMEVNIDLAQGIDFRKGCYVGQELTIRTKHTGVVRKRILPVQLDFTGGPPLHPDPGTDIKQLDDSGAIKKGRAAGKLVASIGDIGLAMCRLEMMTPMKVSGEGGSYKAGMQFGVPVGENGHVVKIKPILHEWFEEREKVLWAKSKTKNAPIAS